MFRYKPAPAEQRGVAVNTSRLPSSAEINSSVDSVRLTMKLGEDGQQVLDGGCATGFCTAAKLLRAVGRKP